MAKSEQFVPDKTRKDGITPLIMAKYEGHAETTQILLEIKADPNYQVLCAVDDEMGCRPIGTFGENEPVPPGQLWYNPVMFAVDCGNHIILEQILSNGGNPNNIDPANRFQQSPLFLARNSDDDSAAKMIDLLLMYQADMHKRIVYPAAALLTQEKTHMRHTLLEIACFAAALEDNPESQSHQKANFFCDHFRTPEGQTVDRSILKWFYAGQFFLKKSCCFQQLL